MSKGKIDPYRELGVEKDASADDIKRAYRKRARETHPDHGGNAEAFARVSTAMTVLGDLKDAMEATV